MLAKFWWKGKRSLKKIYSFLKHGRIIVKYEIILYPACAVMQQIIESVRI